MPRYTVLLLRVAYNLHVEKFIFATWELRRAKCDLNVTRESKVERVPLKQTQRRIIVLVKSWENPLWKVLTE